VALLALCAGCGLALEALSGRRMPGVLIPASGLAVIVVVAGILTAFDATAELATPVVVAVAVGGVGISWRRLSAPSWWAAAAAAGAFAVYSAPVLFSGEATFAGYITLDDTATWLAITDHVLEHGRDLDGLPPSTYQATLEYSLGGGYPIGAFLPHGIASALVGEDIAWTFQPYLAVCGAILALVLWQLAAGLVSSPRLRALTAFIAAQPALLFAYAQWGGVKEMLAAALVALVAALAPAAIRESGPRALAPLAVTAAALLFALSLGGAVWLLPFALAALVPLARRGLAVVNVRRAIPFAAAAVVATIAVALAGVRVLPRGAANLAGGSTLGNLSAPIDVLQLFGVWPAGDFRLEPVDVEITYVLIAVVIAAAAVGCVLAWRARATALLLYLGSALVCGAALFGISSPWIGAKALAIGSPATLLIALAAGAAIAARGRRVEGIVVMLVIGLGVVWSNALAYRDVNLAPAEQLHELESVGDRIAGEGPTLMTEFQPYGVRHFLRDADPEGASELRARPVPLRGGELLEKGEWADTDRLDLGGLAPYRTLVLRRSPEQSRPPSSFAFVDGGRYYEVWQRPRTPAGAVTAHMALGDGADPAARPRCGRVVALAESLGPGGNLTAVARPTPLKTPLELRGPGRRQGRLTVPRDGEYELWARGSVRGELVATVDGREVAVARHELNNSRQYVPLGTVELSAGAHRVALDYGGADLHPGSGPGVPGSIGPLVAVPAADPSLVTVRPGSARTLCGRPWDWIEAVEPVAGEAGEG